VNLEELRSATRTILRDRAKPYLWQDEELNLYLNEAEREATERGQLILDISVPEVAVIKVKAGTRTYKLHPSVIKILRAKLDSGSQPLVETSTQEMDGGLYACGSNWDTLEGPVLRYIQNDDKSITLIRIPVEDDTLRMRVTRFPLRPMKEDRDCPEIATHLHFRMLDWALRCAYRKQDPETLDEKKAAEYEADFTASFGVRPDANVQRKRRDGRKKAVSMGTW
jgi:hypothetical protein